MQNLLSAALNDPVDSIAAFNVFSRLLQQRASASAAAATAAAAAEAAAKTDKQNAVELALHKAEVTFDANKMVKEIKSQIVNEKAEAEVAIALRDRIIGQLRSRLEAVQMTVRQAERNYEEDEDEEALPTLGDVFGVE